MTERPSAEALAKLHARRKRVLGRLVTRLSVNIQDQTIEALHALGFDDLRLSHNNVLIHVEAEGTRITTLAERAKMTKQGMSKLVREVEALGYVERLPDPDDRRAQLVRLTPRGIEMMERALEHFDQQEASLKRRLGEQAYEQLLATLTTLAQWLDEDGF